MSGQFPEFFHAGYFTESMSVNAHSHTGSEIVYVIRGSCTIDFGDRSFVVKEGELCITGPGEVHIQRSEGAIENYYTVFNVDQEFFDSTSRVIDINADKDIALWLEQLARFSDEMCFQQCTGIIYAVLSRIIMLEARLNDKSEIPPQLYRAVKCIDDNLTLPELSLEIIARHSGISISYLKKLFKDQYGISPMQFVQKQRMRKALQMLRNQYLFISEISEKCGYTSANYFSRVFKKTYKKTPLEFRHILSSIDHDISNVDM